MEQFPDVKPHAVVRASMPLAVCWFDIQSCPMTRLLLVQSVGWCCTPVFWHLQAKDLSDPPDVTRLDDVEQQQEQQEPAPV